MGCKGLGVLVLTALLPLSATAATITVQSGETLSDIADRYGVSTRQLMRQNGLRNADHVEAGSRLEVPGPRVSAGPGRHRVQRGDTLDDIAARYRVSSRDLMLVNGLRDANHVELGQTLKLPSNAVIAQPKPKPAPIQVTPGAREHTVGRGQTLTQIARAYELPVATLIDINPISDPNKVTVGTRLYLTAPEQPMAKAEPVAMAKPKPKVKPQPQPTSTSTQARINSKPKAQPQAATVVAKGADWRTYGPLQVDWANWQPMGGSQVVPSLNAEGQALYLAVNCDAKKLNATGADGSWKTWASPKSSFEKDLIKDRCQARA
ncbi:LysM peptidoglycan-binding domain-containing protein [Synechococcus sp. A15-28]|uniref:LysM peptidoglycan-binding domain-containing protein n=1 Tax=Synechococcus sp. A15-28 TaxID=1050638 RepID=UPI001646ED2B|nr:LysM peptidoglycan-binding domain-containing protein [Synechococcus sp. A15-28]QNI43188.1 LysM domain-containing protein [Synechococcus sp. A15-28]